MNQFIDPEALSSVIGKSEEEKEFIPVEALAKSLGSDIPKEPVPSQIKEPISDPMKELVPMDIGTVDVEKLSKKIIPMEKELSEDEKIKSAIQRAHESLEKELATRGHIVYPFGSLSDWYEQSKKGVATLDHLDKSLIRFHMELPELMDQAKRLEISNHLSNKVWEWIKENKYDVGRDLLIGGTVGIAAKGLIGLGLASNPVSAALLAGLFGGALYSLTDIMQGKEPTPIDNIENIGYGMIGAIPISLKNVGSLFDFIRSKPKSALSIGESVINTPKPVSGRFDELTDKVIDYLRKPLDAKIIPMGIFGESWGWAKNRSIAELFEPAVRRMRKEVPELGEYVTNIQYARQELSNKTKSLVESLSRLRSEGKLKDFVDVIHGLDTGNVKGIKSKEAREILKDFFAEPKLTKPDMYYNYVSRTVEKIVDGVDAVASAVKSLGKSETTSALSYLKRYYIGPLEKMIKEKAPVGKIDDFLRDMLTDPATDEATRDVIKQTLFLSKTNMSSLTRAIDHAVFDDMMDFLSKNQHRFVWTKFHSSEKPSDFVRANKWLKGIDKKFGSEVYIPRDLALELETWQYSSKYAASSFNKILNSPMKSFQVLMRPTTQLRNVFGNIVLNDLGGLPFYRVDIYKRAFEGIIRKEKSFEDFMEKIGESPLAVGQLEFSTKEIDDFFKQSKTAVDFGVKLFESARRPFANVFEFNEKWAKYAKYLHNIEKGIPEKEALEDAIKWTFNYGEQTRVVSRLASSIFGHPYARWYANTIPLLMETSIKNPWRLVKWLGMYHLVAAQSINSVGMTRSEWEDFKSKLPDYLNEGLTFPWFTRDNKGRLIVFDASFLMPGFGDIYDLLRTFKAQQSPAFYPFAPFLQHPMMEALNVAQTGQTLDGRQVFYEHEHPSVKAFKTIAYMTSNMVPIIRDMSKLYDIVAGKPDALSPGVFVGRMAGMSMYPKSREEVERAHYYKKQEQLGNISKEYYRAIRQGDEKAAKRYSEYIKEWRSSR